jgi:hypothetical protein
MGMTDEEKFRFDLTGYLLREAILSADEIAAIKEQVETIKSNPESLPPSERAVPGGAAQILIDHPKVIEVLHEIIGPNIRLEGAFAMVRHKGERHGDLHGGGPGQIDPIFGYRCQNGRIHAGMVRVAFELTDIKEEDGATVFIPGSHKANFPMHPDHMSLEDGERSPFLKGYSCPAGSALFFTENLCHAGPVWQRDTPRVAVFFAYSHLATHWHRLTLPPAVVQGLPRERQAYFREPWIADFRTGPATHNTIERFIEKGEAPIDTEHQP